MVGCMMYLVYWELVDYKLYILNCKLGVLYGSELGGR